jgi:hypothetical protein
VPFTPAHPAAILPLLRRGRWVGAGLLTGSIAPDLPTYLPLGLTHEQTHPLTAILWPDGLLAIGALIVWWGPLRPALMSLWPAAAARCGTPSWRDPRIWRTRASAAQWLGWLALSELVGLATHLLWDGFTHRDGYFAEHWSLLDRSIDGHPIFNLLQFWCSVVGMAVVAAYLVVEWRRRSGMAAAASAAAATEGHRHLRAPLRYGVIAVVLLATVLTVLLTGHSVPHPYAIRRAWLWRHRLVAGGGVLLTLLSVWALTHVLAKAALRSRTQTPESQQDPHTKTPADVP